MGDNFGPMITGSDVEEAVTVTLKTWVDTYLAAFALKVDRDRLPSPRSYNSRPSGEMWPEDQLPAVIIVNAGLETEPRRYGDGYFDADVRIGVIVFCTGTTEAGVRRNAQDYAAVVRTLLLQKPGLGGLASGIRWVAESYDAAQDKQARSVAAATIEFVYGISGLSNDMSGPSAPDEPLTDPVGTVESTHLDASRLS